MGLHNFRAKAVDNSCGHLIVSNCQSLSRHTYTICTKRISMVIVTNWLEQYICHKGEGVVLKLEGKTHTLTHKQMSPNVWRLNIQTGRAWWQNVRVSHKMWNVWVHLLSPLVKDVSITCNPVWWSEVVPESRWCFVWSQTGHDQTALPQSSWRATLVCGSRVKEQWECLSSMAGWTERGGGRKPYSPWRARSMGGTRIDKGSDALTSHNHLFATVHTLLLSVSHLVFIKQIHTCKNTRWQESTAVSSQLSNTASTDLKFTGKSGGTHWQLQSNHSNKPRISGNRNGAMCHRSMPSFLWPLQVPNKR